MEIGLRSAADADDLADIYRRIFGEDKAAAKRRAWSWQYDQAPRVATPAAAWVARRDGRAVGHLGTLPVSLWWGDREVRCSWGIDYFVAPESEGQGHSIALVKTWMQSVDVALVVGLAPTSYLICKRLGFRDLGCVPLFQAVLDPAAIARRRWGRLAGGIAAPLGAAWRLAQRRPGGGDVDVAEAGEIGTDYDTLWERARTGFAACVRRDAAYVRWRYREAPHKTYDLVEARRGDTLTGYAVSRHEDYRGLTLGWIVDLFAAPDDTATLDALIADVLGRFAAAGVARAQAFSQHALVAGALRRHGFFAAESHARLCAKLQGVSDAPVDKADAWHMTFGDSDADR